MNLKEMLAYQIQWMSDQLLTVLDGLTVAEIKQRPAPGANPIGWLCWHTTRSCDRLLGDAFLGEQLWISHGWHRKFNREPDFNDTGVGHTDEQVDGLYFPDVQTLRDYHNAVIGRLIGKIETMTDADLDRICPNSYQPENLLPVSRRIVGVLNNLQHVGQAHYARGIIKGHRWYGN